MRNPPSIASTVRPRFSSKTGALQRIDHYVGVPISWILTSLRKVLNAPAPKFSDSCRSILFLKLAEQGSTVLAHQAIRSAAKRVGAANVYFLAFEENRFVVDLLEILPPQNVLTISTHSFPGMIGSCLNRLLEIRRKKIDACIDMEFFSRTSVIISFLTGARMRIGFHTYFGEGPYRGDLLTHRLLYNPHLHTSAVFNTLVAALDVDPASLPTFPITVEAAGVPVVFRSSVDEKNAVRRMLLEAGFSGKGRLVLLNANASDLLPLRKWAEENYVALARAMLAEFPEVIVGFTGSEGEAQKIESLVGEVASLRCISLAGKTTLRQLLVLYELSEILITNDSGPAHFAALTPIDIIALFGPETPRLFAALGPRNHALSANLACSPCVNAFNLRQTACRDNICMQRITVEQVLSKARQLLLERTAAIPAPLDGAGLD